MDIPETDVRLHFKEFFFNIQPHLIDKSRKLMKQNRSVLYWVFGHFWTDKCENIDIPSKLATISLRTCTAPCSCSLVRPCTPWPCWPTCSPVPWPSATCSQVKLTVPRLSSWKIFYQDVHGWLAAMWLGLKEVGWGHLFPSSLNDTWDETLSISRNTEQWLQALILILWGV